MNIGSNQLFQTGALGSLTDRAILDLSSSTRELQSSFQNTLNAEGGFDPLQAIQMQAELQEKTQMWQSLTAMLKSMHEMVMGIVRNFRVS